MAILYVLLNFNGHGRSWKISIQFFWGDSSFSMLYLNNRSELDNVMCELLKCCVASVRVVFLWLSTH